MKWRRLSPRSRGIFLIAVGLNAFAGAAGMLYWTTPEDDVIALFVVAAGVYFVIRGIAWLRRSSATMSAP